MSLVQREAMRRIKQSDSFLKLKKNKNISCQNSA
jgi:hypothetical protein